jgi:primary-amine oxidase
VCDKSPLYQAKIAELELPEGFKVVIEPWPYGGMDPEEENCRYFQGLLFAQDTRSGNPDANFYAFPLPLIPIMDADRQEIVKVIELATGGKGDNLTARTTKRNVVDHCRASEYCPELLPEGPRKDLKPLHVVQPEGPSFTVTDDNLIEWQNWRMRLSFNSREGAVLHDITYGGRNVMHRLSVSEMVSRTMLSDWKRFVANFTRLSRTPTPESPTSESRHSISATAVPATVPTT